MPTTKYKFTDTQRFAIWHHHGPQCYWCGEPLRLQDTTIDHVIPEHLLDTPQEVARLKQEYGLPATFEINDYCNWIPCHDGCNNTKHKKVFKAAPWIVGVLGKLDAKAGEVSATVERVLNNTKADKLLGKVMAALENQLISRDDLLNLVSELNLVPEETFKSLHGALHLHVDPSRWTVTQVNGELAIVTNGQFGGATPISENPDSSWQCPTCFSYGPWNGARCMSCGHFSCPGD